MPNFYKDKLDEQNQTEAEEIISIGNDHDEMVERYTCDVRGRNIFFENQD